MALTLQQAPAARGQTVPESIKFSPPVLTLNSPAQPGSRVPSENLSLKVSVVDATGSAVPPSAEHPIVLQLYGPSPSPVNPVKATIISPAQADVTFRYDGSYFKNAMTLTATIGSASATTLLVGATNLPCSPARGLAVTVPFADRSRITQSGFWLNVSVGGGKDREVLVDTGSAGLAINRSALGPQAIGPGKPGWREYYPMGLVFRGHYYLTSITMKIRDSAGGPPRELRTVPIEVFVADKVACDTWIPQCGRHHLQKTSWLARNLGVLGVGFSRNPVFPAENPFLQLTDVVSGKMSPGYIFSADHITLGVPSELSPNFRFIDLTRNARSPGEWALAPGCYRLPEIDSRFRCGSILLDTGINQILLRVPTAQLAETPLASPGYVMPGTEVSIVAPSPETQPPAMSYRFRYEPGQVASSSAPSVIRISPYRDERPFINIGRNPVLEYDYLFDAACGHVGFAPSSAAKE